LCGSRFLETLDWLMADSPWNMGLGKYHMGRSALLGRALVLALCLAGITAVQPAFAAEVIDQSALVGPLPVAPQAGRILTFAGTRPQGYTNALVGQTVTAGMSGLLSRIDVQVFNLNPQAIGILEFGLFDGDASAGGSLLGSEALSLSLLPGGPLLSQPGVIFGFDVSSLGYYVTAGQRFSFGFRVNGPNSDSAAFVIGNGSRPNPNAPPVLNYNSYAGGALLFSNNGAPLAAFSQADLGFRSWVDTARQRGVPEPATWAMMIVGFGAIGGSMRRKAPAKPALA
jgi:PEP-CTERM motif